MYGVEPEIQAYAMAKLFALRAVDEGVAEGDQHAEGGEISQHFLFSVWAPFDCRPGAHCAGGRESLSILAAIVVADEQRWDGQERSTRYQDFKKSGYYTPDFGGDDEARERFTARHGFSVR